MKHFMMRTAKFGALAVIFAAVALVDVARAVTTYVVPCTKTSVARSFATAFTGTPTATGAAVYDAVEWGSLDGLGGFTGYITWHSNGAAATATANGAYVWEQEVGTYTVSSNCTGTISFSVTAGPLGTGAVTQTWAVNFALWPDPREIQAIETDALGAAIKDMKEISSHDGCSATVLGQPYEVDDVNYAPTFAGAWSGWRTTTPYVAAMIGTFTDVSGDQGFNDQITYTMGGVSNVGGLSAGFTLDTNGDTGALNGCVGALSFTNTFVGGFAMIVDTHVHRVYIAEMDANGAMAAVLVQIQQEVE